MRVDETSPRDAPSAARKETFQLSLAAPKVRRPTPSAQPRTSLIARSPVGTVARRSDQAGTTPRVDEEGARLKRVRVAHHSTASEGEQARTEALNALEANKVDRLLLTALRDLVPEPRNPDRGADGLSPGAAQAEVSANAPRALLEAPRSPAPGSELLRKLIEKIEFFVRAQRPTLKVTLKEGLKGTVEVERVGPKRVALTISDASQLPVGWGERLRQELASRGLTLTTLSVVPP